ncbi:hypothetical protein V6N11_042400 [Hibiscus sabdariffa]|uniref:Uncharacterized protein n=1 Tax=Hibiscus sabdariffa TaxID=183260 RepID=A0ABR2QW79_9ROSI
MAAAKAAARRKQGRRLQHFQKRDIGRSCCAGGADTSLQHWFCCGFDVDKVQCLYPLSLNFERVQ